MSIERMFELLDGLRGAASADAAFGRPEQAEGRVFISVANVRTGFGLGFGQGAREQESACCEEQEVAAEEADDPEETHEDDVGAVGGGAGGQARSRPVAVIEITPDKTIIRPIVDETKVALAGVVLVGWVAFVVAVTVRAILGQRGDS